MWVRFARTLSERRGRSLVVAFFGAKKRRASDASPIRPPHDLGLLCGLAWRPPIERSAEADEQLAALAGSQLDEVVNKYTKPADDDFHQGGDVRPATASQRELVCSSAQTGAQSTESASRRCHELNRDGPSPTSRCRW